MMDVKRILSVVMVAALLCGAARSQQVVERGVAGRPGQLVDETGGWSAPVRVASDQDIAIYIPDVTNPSWLALNYPEFRDRGNYKLSLYVSYKTPAACRAFLIAWGQGDGEHLKECISIGYRVFHTVMHPQDKSVTALNAAMIDSNGSIQQSSVQTDKVFRFWSQLEPTTQQAVEKANHLAVEQLKIYEHRIQNNP